MSFQSKILFSDVQYPEITKHLETMNSKERAEKIRALAHAAFMLETGKWDIVPKGSYVTQIRTMAQEAPTGFGADFRKTASL